MASPDMEFPTHADYLALELSRMGVTDVFCLMGDTNLDFIGALLRQNIRLIHGRHEQGVAAMADGYARFTGRTIPAVCTVTQGAGLTNTTTSLLTALNAGSGVLLITGDNSRNTTEQRFDQKAYCRMVSHNAATISDAGSMYKGVQRVLTSLAEGNGAGILNIDVALWYKPVASARHLAYTKKTMPPAPIAMLTKVVGLLKAAKRPAILAGRGAAYSHADSIVITLAEKLGSPIVTTVPALGFASGHPLSAGTAGTIGVGPGSQALREADCILAIGSRMSHWTLDEGIVTYQKPVIRIDCEANAQNPGDFINLHGDAAVITALLAESLAINSRSPWFSPVISPPTIVASQALNPFSVFDRLQQILPKERIIIVDAGQNTIFAMRMLQVAHNSDFAWTSDFAAIGQGLGVAIGAAFARPNERITLVVGDGGFMMSIAELDTIARYSLAITIIVINDQGFGQERGALTARSISEAEAAYTSPDLAALARVYGIAGQHVDDDAGLTSLSAVLKDISGPIVVDIRTDPAIRTDFGSRVAEHRKAATRLVRS